MEVAGKMVVYLELKSSADKFFKLLGKQTHQVPVAASDKIHKVEVHEGDWETHGSVKQWTYTMDGKKEMFKEKVHLDEAKNSVTFVAVEGHVLELYKSFKVTYEFAPKGAGSLLTASVEYEKIKAELPRPNNYLDFIIHALKDMDAHLGKA